MSNLQKIVNEKIKELTGEYKIEGGSFEKREIKINNIYKIYKKIMKYDTISEKDIKDLEKNEKIITDSPIYKFCLLRSLKKIIEKYEINDPNYFDYPDKDDKRFGEKIYEKKEFNMFGISKESRGLINICANKEFEISSHQLFLKNFLTKETPYNGVLMFHGVGVGKTCSAITISENFRDMYATREKRIIILCSKNIKIGWKKTIFNPDLGENQCSGNIFLKRNIKTKREVNRLVRDYYEIMAYLSFANYVKRLIKIKGRKYLKNTYEERERLVINELFSNRLLIIDEVHNLRDDGEKDIKESVDMIEKVIKYSDNLKIVLLSATPMYNRSTEIIRLLNMLLLNDNRGLIEKDKIFLKDGSLKKGGSNILKEIMRGYVSYVRGEDPSSFPVRLYPSHTGAFKSYNSNIDGKESLSMILDTENYPKNDMKDKEIVESKKLSFLETFGSKMVRGSHQWKIYNRLEKEVLENSSEEEMLPSIMDINRVIRAGNIVYPYKPDESENIRIDETISAKGLKNTFSVKNKSSSVEYSYKKEVLKDCGPFLDRELIGDYSVKIKIILDLIDKSDGIIFIYSNWIKSGVIPLVLALEQNGYKKYSGENVLNFPEYEEGKEKHSTKRKIQTIISKDDMKEYPLRYMVISGGEDKLSRDIEGELKVVTAPDNHDGKNIKIIVGSSVASEGIDFKRIRNIHILEPWLHLNRLEQTIGRGIRFCSHGDIDEDKRNVLVYLHAIVNTNNNESMDSAVYRYAEKKAIDIGEIEDILKRGAIDRFLFRHKNIVGEKDVVENEIITPYDNTKIKYKANDKPYSKICSYLPKSKCNFNKDLSRVKYETLFNNPKINIDTMNYNYSDRYVDVMIKRIIELYTQKSVYEIEELLKVLRQYYNIDEDIVFISLQRIINEKRLIYNHLGIRGNIIYRGRYYLFQPIEINDNNIPYYYRCYPEIVYPHNILIPKEKMKKDILQIKARYELNDISVTLNELNSVIDGDEEEYIEIFKDINILNNSFKHYYVDRLTADLKVPLIYSILMNLHDDNELFDILSYNFIYKNDGKYSLRYGNKDNKTNIFGFFVIYHHSPQFLIIENGDIRPMNTFERRDVLKDLNVFTRTQKYMEIVDMEKIWGYTTSQKSQKRENIVFKIVDDTDNTEKSKVYPPGPGKMCVASTLGFKKHDIINMIISEFPRLVDDIFKVSYNDKKHNILSVEKSKTSDSIIYTLDTDDKIIETDLTFSKIYEKIILNKRTTCKLFEILCRYRKIKEGTQNYLSYDEMWLKYPPFNFENKIEIIEI
jgi:hypothetical protein